VKRTARKDVTVPIATSPTDGSGTFTGFIHPFEIDSDNERIENFTNLPARLPLLYQHAYGDKGARIGEVLVTHDKAGNRLKATGELFIADNPMSVAVYERMLMPDYNDLALREFSIGFAYSPATTYEGEKGERVIPDAELLEVSCVYRGAQRTELVSVKERSANELATLFRLQRRIELLDPLSLVSIAKELEAIEGASNERDRKLRKLLDWADAIPTTASHKLHSDDEIRRLIEQLDELAGPATTNPQKRAAAARQDARDVKAAEGALIRAMIDRHELDVLG
jgi:Caudovirus prohead serine protease